MARCLSPVLWYSPLWCSDSLLDFRTYTYTQNRHKAEHMTDRMASARPALGHRPAPTASDLSSGDSLGHGTALGRTEGIAKSFR